MKLESFWFGVFKDRLSMISFEIELNDFDEDSFSTFVDWEELINSTNRIDWFVFALMISNTVCVFHYKSAEVKLSSFE